MHRRGGKSPAEGGRRRRPGADGASTADQPERGEAGLVVASYGRRCLVEDTAGERHRCVPRGRRLRLVCGDRVCWQRASGESREDGVVLSIEPRHNELERPNLRGRNEVLAANITQLVVVTAPAPAPDPFLVDRYLAQAQLMGCEAIVIRSKADLLSNDGRLDSALAEWANVGYRVLQASVEDPAMLAYVHEALAGHVSILVGQSGVGKSSLLNALVPSLELATGELSGASGEGRHTTTTSRLFHLPHGGGVIDSPGVRDYAPGRVAEREVAMGYREIAERARGCRFANCMHLLEPDCAVHAAVQSGEIAERRYESYRRLVRLMNTLGEGIY